ncbi:MAG: phosphonate ABC transporter, permease protein PhnE [Candidatus Tectomicrobia bacterium]|uniref:Phosphonate ABC transporter, permease protein PhnE n=1 Tax=Tectimicrobiota bacterium TaxID=2528274 RepID=A0A937VZW7_UNCTE|nr:phosphonate ABC transporter, permease protein PhnE [Candidatus Tectomicrobia bacterium]
MDRLRTRLTITCGFLLFVLACFFSLSGDWSGLFSRESASRMLELVTSFFPLELSATFLRKAAYATLETLAISWIGTLLAVIAGLFFALPAAHMWGAFLQGMARIVLNVLRAVPELVWAALFVIAAGLGPFPGTLALAVHTTGVLGRLFAEALENAPREPYLALRRHGVGPIAAFSYGLLPHITPQLASYTLYRWENNIRAAAVLGVAGAGGLGQMLYYHMGLFHFHETGTILLAMLLLVGLVDTCSNWLRMRAIR